MFLDCHVLARDSPAEDSYGDKTFQDSLSCTDLFSSNGQLDTQVHSTVMR